MKLYTAEQMRQADRAAMDAGVASVLLMEAAGRGVAELLQTWWPEATSVLVLCGPGNNGGDGWVTARYLALAGLDVDVLEMSSDPPSEDAARARRAYLAIAEGSPLSLEASVLTGFLPHVDVVVDALLGSGLSRPLEGSLVDIAGVLADSGVDVLAVDVPTGISADAAVPPGEHVRATATAQLAGPKRSCALAPSRSAYGTWRVVDIGIPAQILDRMSSLALLAADHPPPPTQARPEGAHKYSGGTVLIVAGSTRYLGAAELACRGAYRGGAGLVTLAAEDRLAGGWPEVVFVPIDWDEAPMSTLREIEAKRAGCVVIGPGLDPRAEAFLPEIPAAFEGPLVLDAGALQSTPELRAAVGEHGLCLLTPHIGEAARLLGVASGDVLADPVGSAVRLAETWNAVVALKGATTVVARPSGRAAVSTTGHPGMATGGTGDVLAGLMGAMLARAGVDSTEDVADVAERAVWLHGLAGEEAAERYGLGLTASDVADAIGRLQPG